MVAVPCDKCNGTGTIDVQMTYCEAKIKIQHETFECYAQVQHPGQVHMALLAKQCPACKGYDEHTNECLRKGETTHQTVVLDWHDDQSYTFATNEEWNEWRTKYVTGR